MEFTSYDFFGALLGTAGFGLFAWQSVKRWKNQNVSPLLTLLALGLIGFTFLYRFLFQSAELTTQMQGVLQDAGIGAFLASFYLMSKRSKVLVLLIPGLLLLFFSATVRFSDVVWEWLSGDKRPATEAAANTDAASLLVELGPDDSIEELAELLEAYDATAERAFRNVTLEEDEDLAQFYLVILPDAARREAFMEALRADKENVDFVEVNDPVQLSPPADVRFSRPDFRPGPVVSDPEFEKQWAFRSPEYVQALQLLKRLRPRKKAKVAILDTGVDGRHEDMAPAFNRRSPNTTDKHGHGTHCAGIAGAPANNRIGIASFNYEGRYVQILSFPALNQYGGGTDKSIAQAIIDAAESGVDVISLSLGGPNKTPSRVQQQAIEYALSLNCIVVAAAGNNSGPAREQSPANVPGVITVTAIGPNGKAARFTNTVEGLKRPVAAPGVEIHSLKANGGYVAFNGTSMATPLVAGLLGVMRALRPNLSAEAAYKFLRQNGKTTDEFEQLGPVLQPHKTLRALRPGA